MSSLIRRRATVALLIRKKKYGGGAGAGAQGGSAVDITAAVIATLVPIKGASVTMAPGSYSGTSNATGDVVFQGVPFGTYTVHVTAPNYTPSGPVIVVVNQTVVTKTILLTPTISNISTTGIALGQAKASTSFTNPAINANVGAGGLARVANIVVGETVPPSTATAKGTAKVTQIIASNPAINVSASASGRGVASNVTPGGGSNAGPWYFPHAPLPASQIDWVIVPGGGKLTNNPQNFAVTIPALCGLLAKTQPRLAHVAGNGNKSSAGYNDGSFWLNDATYGVQAYAKSQGITMTIATTNLTPINAIKKYVGNGAGQIPPKLIKYNDGDPVQASCAASISGVTGWLPVSAADLSTVTGAISGATVALDITGGMTYQQLWNQYGSKFAKSTNPPNSFIYFNVQTSQHMDYQIFAGALTFDQLGTGSTDTSTGTGLAASIFNSYPAGTMVIGFWTLNSSGQPVLNFVDPSTGNPITGEVTTVSYLTPKGIGVHAADRGVHSITLTSGLPAFTGTQIAMQRITYDSSKTYIMVTESQGDAWGYNCQNNWQDVQQVITNGVPISFPIALAMSTLAPHVTAAWYSFAQKSSLVHLYAGPGGVGYTHIQQMSSVSPGFASTWFTGQVLPLMQDLDMTEIFNIPDGTSKQNGANLLAAAFPNGTLSAIFNYQLQNLGNLCSGTGGAQLGDTTNSVSPKVPFTVNDIVDYNMVGYTDLVTAIKGNAASCNFIEIMVNTTNNGQVPSDMAAAKSSLGSSYVWCRSDQWIDLLQQAGLV